MAHYIALQNKIDSNSKVKFKNRSFEVPFPSVKILWWSQNDNIHSANDIVPNKYIFFKKKSFLRKSEMAVANNSPILREIPSKI